MEQYTVAIGDLVVVVKKDRSNDYLVTCPFDPELVTQGRTLDEAVAMARDAKKTLDAARAKDAKKTMAKAANKPRAKRTLTGARP